MRAVITGAILLASLLDAGVSHAAWPERPVAIVVPFAAGGIADVIARLAAEPRGQRDLGKASGSSRRPTR